MMSSYPVSPAKQAALIAKMATLGIQETDLEEQFVRASGHGGQKVNKTSSCVILRHAPTNTVIRCEQERSQALNRFLARRLLIEKIETEQFKKQSEHFQKIAKIKRQKRKRSKRAKEKILAAKHHQAEKKKHRQSVSLNLSRQ